MENFGFCSKQNSKQNFGFLVIVWRFHCRSQTKRYTKLINVRDELTEIYKDLGEDIITEFEQDVVVEDSDCFVLSENNMISLDELLQQVL